MFQVLREVHEQEIIEEIPEPIFSVAMILKTPLRASASGGSPVSNRSAALHSAMRSVSVHMRNTHGRKEVTFPERVTSSVEMEDS